MQWQAVEMPAKWDMLWAAKHGALIGAVGGIFEAFQHDAFADITYLALLIVGPIVGGAVFFAFLAALRNFLVR
jgi:hypothetical protein